MQFCLRTYDFNYIYNIYFSQGILAEAHSHHTPCILEEQKYTEISKGDIGGKG